MAISETELYNFLHTNDLVSRDLFELTAEDKADGISTVKEKLDLELLKDLSDNYAVISEAGKPNQELVVFFNEDGIADYVTDKLKYEMDDDAVVRLVGDLSNGFADVLTLWRMEPKQEGEFMVANTTKTTASKLASILKVAKGIGKYRRGEVLTDITSVSPGQLLVLDSIKYKAVDLIKVTQTFKDKFYSVFVNPENPVELRSKGDEEFAVYSTDLKQGEYYIALEPSPTAITPEVDDGTGEKTSVAPVPEAEQKPVPEEKPDVAEAKPEPAAVPEKEAVGASKKTASLYGSYNELGYEIWDTDQNDPVYTAGNSGADSQAYVAAEEGVGRKTMQEYCEKTGKEMAAELGKEWAGAEYTEPELPIAEAAKKTAIESPVRKQQDYGEVSAVATERQAQIDKKIADLDTTLDLERHKTTKSPTDPTFNKEWSGVSGAPHAKGKTCPDCGEQLHKESDSFYCPSCDDYKAPKEGRASKKTLAIGGDDTAANVLNPPDANPITVDVPTHTSYSRYVEDTKTAASEDRDKCSKCGLPIPAMPEDASDEEMLCDKCYEEQEQEQKPVYEFESAYDNTEDLNNALEEHGSDFDEDIVINPDEYTAFYGGHAIATGEGASGDKDAKMADLARKVHEWMEKKQFWPSIFIQGERDNIYPMLIVKKGALDDFELDQEIMTSGDYRGAVGSHVSNIASLLANTETIASATGGEGDDGSAYRLDVDRNFTGVNEDEVTGLVDEYLGGKAASLASFEDFAGFIEDVYGIKKEASVSVAEAWYDDNTKAIVAFIKENAVQDLLG